MDEKGGESNRVCDNGHTAIRSAAGGHRARMPAKDLNRQSCPLIAETATRCRVNLAENLLDRERSFHDPATTGGYSD